jgi:hypothetical protein
VGNRLSYGVSSEYSQFGNGNVSKFLGSEGRGAAAEVDAWLKGSTRLPLAGGIKPRVCRDSGFWGYQELTWSNQTFVPPPSNVSGLKMVDVEA